MKGVTQVTDSSPTAQAVLLGEELRGYREALGLTQFEVARRVGTYHSTINKIENAKRHAPEPVLRGMLQVYGVAEKAIEDFVRRARQARTPGWWADHKDTVPHWFLRYVGLEAAAIAKRTYEAELVPGLLQTRRYTEAVATVVRGAGPSDSAESLVSVRTTRQRRLYDPDPLTLTAVLNEAVIRRPVGGPDVMREQLAYLVEMTARPNITLHILPFAAREHPAMSGTFTMLQFCEQSINTVYVEHPNGAMYVDEPEDVQRYETTFRQLTHLALSEAETIEMLERTEY